MKMQLIWVSGVKKTVSDGYISYISYPFVPGNYVVRHGNVFFGFIYVYFR